MNVETAGTKHFDVIRDNFSAAKPFAVLRNFRRFNTVVARYQSVEQARKRALAMEARHGAELP